VDCEVVAVADVGATQAKLTRRAGDYAGHVLLAEHLEPWSGPADREPCVS
jgi:hypothetical protein